MPRAASGLCAAILLAAAAYYALGVIRPAAELGWGVPSYDIYAYFYPNIRYALDSLARGDGLLWNPYQNCGQPFFAFSITGLLYPVNWVFLVLPREAGLLATIVLNLSVAGVGAWGLGRAMGLSRPAALAGGLAFAYGCSALLLAAWSPMHIAPYAWMPVALAATERLLHAPSPRRGAVLGLALTLQLLPGFPQVTFFTYLLIAARVAWEVMTVGAARRGALLASLGLGLALPPLLAAVQFLPSLEVATSSVRSLPLKPWEIGTGVPLADVRASVGRGIVLQGAVTLTALAVACVGLASGETRRLAIFYLAIAAVSILVALGDASPAWWLYQQLPGGRSFRSPQRLLWVTNFALAAACGLGVEAALRSRSWPSRFGLALALGAGLAVFAALPPHTVAESEWRLLAAVAIAVAAAAYTPRLGALAGLAIGVTLAANTLQVGGSLLGHRTGDVYGDRIAVLERVRARMTAQDRALIIGAHEGFQADLALIDKVATIYRIPSIFDYEPQASLRYAQYFTFMRTGQAMANVFDWDRFLNGILTPALQRPLFDLTAARFVIVDESKDQTMAALGDSAAEIFRDGSVRVYENQRALPRAFVVPHVDHVPDDQVLPMLADGRADPRRTALVGAGDDIALAGTARATNGRATFARDDPQTVAIDVETDAPAFLFLADQYDPGWTAEVNGVPSAVVRANHAFRLVSVPAGRSRVVFRYRPRSLRVGAAISLVTALVTAGCLWRGGGGAPA